MNKTYKTRVILPTQNNGLEETVSSKEWEIGVSYKCNTCAVYESKANELLSHTVRAHCFNCFYTCHVCKKFRSQEKDELISHFKSFHGIKSDHKITCPVCFSYSSDLNSDLEEHITRDHWSVKAVQTCVKCFFKCENNIEEHIKSTHSIFCCSFRKCRFKGDNALSLLDHIIFTHFPILTLYYELDMDFEKKNDLIRHLKKRLHMNKKPDYLLEISCHLCSNNVFGSSETYLNHLTSSHPWFRLPCPFKLCSYVTKRFWGLTYHVINTHIVSKSFICPFCGEHFPTVSSGSQHTSTEHNEKVFMKTLSICKICDLEVFNHLMILDHLHENHDLYIPPEIDMLFWKKEKLHKSHSDISLNKHKKYNFYKECFEDSNTSSGMRTISQSLDSLDNERFDKFLDSCHEYLQRKSQVPIEPYYQRITSVEVSQFNYIDPFIQFDGKDEEHLADESQHKMYSKIMDTKGAKYQQEETNRQTCQSVMEQNPTSTCQNVLLPKSSFSDKAATQTTNPYHEVQHNYYDASFFLQSGIVEPPPQPLKRYKISQSRLSYTISNSNNEEKCVNTQENNNVKQDNYEGPSSPVSDIVASSPQPLNSITQSTLPHTISDSNEEEDFVHTKENENGTSSLVSVTVVEEPLPQPSRQNQPLQTPLPQNNYSSSNKTNFVNTKENNKAKDENCDDDCCCTIL